MRWQPLIFLAFPSWHGTSTLQASWDGGDRAPVFSASAPGGELPSYALELGEEGKLLPFSHACPEQIFWNMGPGKIRNGSLPFPVGNFSSKLWAGGRGGPCLRGCTWLEQSFYNMKQLQRGVREWVLAQMSQTLTVLTKIQQIFLNESFSLCCMPLGKFSETLNASFIIFTSDLFFLLLYSESFEATQFIIWLERDRLYSFT